MKRFLSRVGLALFTILAFALSALDWLERAFTRLVWPIANLGMAGIVDIVAPEGPQSDGAVMFASTTGMGGIFGIPSAGPTTQPSNPSQAQAAFALGISAVVVYYSTQDPANVAANTTAEQDFTVTGVAAGSVVHAIKPTTDAGLCVDSARVKAANTVSVTFSNVTAAGINAASELWIFVEFRGPLIQSQAIAAGVISAVPSLTTLEQVFTCTPASGQQGLASAKLGLTSGVTTLSQNPPAATSLAAGAQPTSINRTPVLKGNPQTVIVNKPTAQAGLGIVNARLADNNQLAITYVNTSGAPITPTAETYTFVAFHGIAFNTGVMHYLVNWGAPAQVNTVTAPEQTFTVNGLAVGDTILAVNRATDQAGLAIGQCRVTAANTLGIKFINPTAGNITPTASEVVDVVVLKDRAGKGAIATQFTAFINPAAVATITSAEQTFAVTGIVSAAPVVVNAYGTALVTDTFANSMGKALPAGLMIGGARASGAGTLAINFGNVTGASITPGPIMLTILQFQPDQGGATAGAAGSAIVYPLVNQDVQQAEQLAALFNAFTALSAIAGS